MPQRSAGMANDEADRARERREGNHKKYIRALRFTRLLGRAALPVKVL
ncbi:MAG TPA: hypothetical protein VNN73_17375 [Blastocatellia bacterium]|nr:hypothetical protein [Blastocatellia bacterium]